MRIIDLSAPLSTQGAAPTKVHIKRVNHLRGIKMLELEAGIMEPSVIKRVRNLLCYLLGIRRIGRKNFPEGEGLAWETIKTITHRGTHMDAPYHFGSKCGEVAARTIDQIPLEWCYHDGVLLDFSYKKAQELITAEDIKQELIRINYKLKPFDIVILKTGMEKFWKTSSYLTDYPGLSIEGLFYLLDKGIKIIGVDSYSLDRPSYLMVNEYFNSNKNSDVLWPTHIAGRQEEYCHIEQLMNLDRLERPFGFKVSCFPIAIERGSAGWCRVVALMNDDE